MIGKVNAKTANTAVQLTQNNNDLKQLIAKHKNGKQICLDLGMLMLLLVLLGILISMLSNKGYI